MLFTEDELRRLIAGEPVGDHWPYAGGSEADIEGHLHRAAGRMRHLRLLDSEADLDHYGSGYASYVPVFCWKRRGASTQRRGDTEWITGVQVYLSRLAPVAVWGSETRTRGPNGAGSFGFLEPHRLYRLPAGDWDAERQELERALKEAGFLQPDVETLCLPLAFEAKIPTILADPPYRIFDALFYWED